MDGLDRPSGTGFNPLQLINCRTAVLVWFRINSLQSTLKQKAPPGPFPGELFSINRKYTTWLLLRVQDRVDPDEAVVEVVAGEGVAGGG
jgi:hypothetical protein